jgi:hypothetical protein
MKHVPEHEQLRGRDESSPWSTDALSNEIRDALVRPARLGDCLLDNAALRTIDRHLRGRLFQFDLPKMR